MRKCLTTGSLLEYLEKYPKNTPVRIQWCEMGIMVWEEDGAILFEEVDEDSRVKHNGEHYKHSSVDDFSIISLDIPEEGDDDEEL